jgi:DNA-binding CsgD family transcriptional regulator
VIVGNSDGIGVAFSSWRRLMMGIRCRTATLKAYVSRVLAKLDCANRVQVAIVVHEAR